MIKIITHQRLKNFASSYYKIKSKYKIINKQLYYFEGIQHKKVFLECPFSDIDLYCNPDTIYYKDLQSLFKTKEPVTLFGYNNNFSKYLFWQISNEFNINPKIVLLSTNNTKTEYVIKSEDVRKAIALFYLNFVISREIDKEFRLVNLYEAFLFKQKKKSNKITKRNSAKIENHLLYTKRPDIYNSFNINKKTFNINGLWFIITSFYNIPRAKSDAIIYILERFKVIKRIKKEFYEDDLQFLSLDDIYNVGINDLKNIILDNQFVYIQKSLRLDTREFIDTYTIEDPILRAISKFTKTEGIYEISTSYYKFLISLSQFLFYVFEEDLFSNFITSDSHYAIKSNKYEEIINEIQMNYPLSFKNVIEEKEAIKIKEKLSKDDEFKNFNELVLHGNKENVVILKSEYELHKLKYIELVNPELASKEKLIQLDQCISHFSVGEISFQDFLSRIEFINKTTE